MYHSLIATGDVFTLYIFCFDDLSYGLLSALNLPHIVLISLDNFETASLKKIKAQRTKGEYCWTCTPHTIRHVLDKYHLNQVTYCDADIYFFTKPSILLAELEERKASVMITKHRYTPRYDMSVKAGIYCVQFITFNADPKGYKVLQWWQDRCLEWCYNRFKDGKFGDQKYLDDWPERFEGVHVLENLGGGVASWNVQQYEVTEGPLINNERVIFYHFHRLTWYTNNSFDLWLHKLSDNAIHYIYLPYLSALEKALLQIRSIEPGFSNGIVPLKRNLITGLRSLKRKLLGEYHVVQK
jgi:hypothetical protein